MNCEEFNFNSIKNIYPTIENSSINMSITQNRIVEDLLEVYRSFCQELIDLEIYISKNELELISSLIGNDLRARVGQDPIALSEEFIYSLSRSFRVIFYYRLAHFIYNKNEVNDINNICRYCAFKISEYATMTTAIEIHPEAKIGKSFVIDHGVNTLIGATSEIGDNCTILQNVVLGSRKITFNSNVKRHPTIGNNVHISGGVRILGAINIGNNVTIGPDCLIIKDILDHSTVKLERKHTVILEKK
jgi:serine O-acetyltransferase